LPGDRMKTVRHFATGRAYFATLAESPLQNLKSTSTAKRFAERISPMFRSKMYNTVLVAIALSTGASQAIAQVQSIQSKGDVTSYSIPQDWPGRVDFANAKAMPLPQSSTPFDAVQSTVSALLRAPETSGASFSAGASGDGAESPSFLGASAAAEADGGMGSQNWGTANLPFSSARADLSIATNTAYPYRASGKLFFTDGGSTYVCSASLIKRGIVVTAAHCVAAFGASRFYTNFRFVPGYRNGVAPFRVWSARTAAVLTSYFRGTDTCSVRGVVCANDVAVIVLAAQTGSYPGTSTGWYGYGWNGWGFVNNTTHLTQIGYPNCLDNGLLMERNDVQGVRNAAFTNNTTYGSLMCGGSSGGPLLANFGMSPALTGTTAGAASNPNIVIGVTSWGYISSSVKQQGASPFTSGNIVALVNFACSLGGGNCL
jgi:V8-like Glu-specific endopeptidase